MKKDSYFQLSSLASDLLKEKQTISSTNHAPPPNFSSSSSKKNIAQVHNFQPVAIQNKSFQYDSRNQEKERLGQNASFGVENPERIKATSFQERGGKGSSKFEYLAFVQKQYKEERERKAEDQKEKQRTVTKESDSAVINQQLAALKAKLQKLSNELQKKDELIVKKEKELVQKGNKIVQLEQKVGQLEKQCSNVHNNYGFLHDQFLQSEREKEFYVGVADKQAAIAEKCKQLQAILQQKDTYIQSIIAAKNNQYNSLVNSRNQEVKTLQQRIAILERDNLQLAEAGDLPSQPTQTTSQIQISKFQQLGQQFQQKLGFFTSEQQRLKNVISNQQGEIEQLRVQKQSLQATLRAYEERDSVQRDSVLQQEILRLRQALDSEKQQKDRAVSRQQLQILRLQNQLSSKQLSLHNSLIGIFDQQRLRESLLLALQELSRLRK